ncbi:MAG: ligase-associated DNA damage response DEXH box helicase, partial [Chlorobia bacterium]|nr:ligase-associated DNA damage response DEXH box helicase [Fimbriimonadaceae bacterium]
MVADGLAQIESYFQGKGWTPFEFQREVWRAYREGKSGLIHSATGTGKTFAAWLGPVAEALESESSPGLKVLWITPLRALSADTQYSLEFPLKDLGLEWQVQTRTGDTTTSEKTKQNKELPHGLVTTPESLSLLLSRENHRELLSGLQCVVIDEWHELLSTKRGVQAELCLARLRTICPGLRIWGISATLGNQLEALQTLLGSAYNPESAVLIKGDIEKEIVIDSVLPESIDRFPWAGHFGTQMIPQVIQAIEESSSCLVFCNTRAMAEIWFQSILGMRLDWKGKVELHHGSLDREFREAVEEGIKRGLLRAVVCTSSLDLGVDFSPVDRVIQVGSPKGVARLLQRAGRSGHRPGVASQIICVPTHGLELIDIAAARDAAYAGKIESREGVERPLDVLAQHLVTIALGEGFLESEMKDEVRSSHSYRNLTDSEWQWVMDFVVRGGSALQAYPEFRRVVLQLDGRYRVEDKQIALRHRLSIGTIMSDSALTVQYVKGSRLGTVEESFLSRLNPGDRFIFSGKPLEFVRIRDMTAYVKPAPSVKGAVPRWAGGRLPLSSELAHAIREKLHEARHGVFESAEMQLIRPLLQVQNEWSAIPDEDEFLIEKVETRDGHHLFFYPFEGRLVHEGLAALFAYRIARHRPISFTIACNDYGFELLAGEPAPLAEALADDLLSSENLNHDILESLNSVEMARRQFREVARIAGLVFQGYPGAAKSAKQFQASSGLYYDVLRRYDPENMLLHQAEKEVLEKQLESSRMAQVLRRLQKARVVITEPTRPTPLAFPILVDRLRDTLSTESVSDRIEKLA